ncbi:hypothetical protein DFH07DRAFT_449545 [Mycena maculata]|uniref:Uncharacterized protein n=1 Tax=Mycena maculata TaxID=230809 RepID=A0AAD7J7J4_9AGAR|nr:hypothetical protein DFH07DRAFT_449545 [Mycena maculata]
MIAAIALLAFVATGLAQGDATGVTLWQFGSPRLLDAEVTLPLLPLGTASGGVETTYLFQGVNPATVVTIDETGFSTEVIPSTAPRTIVASASGWFEIFGSTTGIACSFVNSDFGQCVDGTSTVPANSGVPTPDVLQLSLTTALEPTSIIVSPFIASSSSSSSVTPSSSSSSSTAEENPPKKSSPVGAIVGEDGKGRSRKRSLPAHWHAPGHK